MNLTIDDKKVLEAAEKCPQAKTVLQTLFPDVFGDPKMMEVQISDRFLQVRDYSYDKTYHKKSFYLDHCYTWSIETDSLGQKCLVPRRK